MGYFVSDFAVKRTNQLKYFLIFLGFVLTFFSFFLIYSDFPLIVTLLTILALVRWMKFLFQNFPLIKQNEALVNFGSSIFLSFGSLFFFIFMSWPVIDALKLIQLAFLILCIPVLIISSICYIDENIYHNYYKEFVSSFIIHSKSKKAKNAKKE